MAHDPSSSTGQAVEDFVYQVTKRDEVLNGEKMASQANNSKWSKPSTPYSLGLIFSPVNKILSINTHRIWICS